MNSGRIRWRGKVRIRPLPASKGLSTPSVTEAPPPVTPEAQSSVEALPAPVEATVELPAPVVEEKAQPEVEASPPAESPEESLDLSILSLTLSKLAEELATGKWDPDVPALIQAEQEGKNRKGALSLLGERLA